MHYTAVDNEFLVVPNPNSGKFEIQLSENISYPASATFYTLEGTLVRQLTIHNNSIELSGFNEGLYFIHLQYDDKKSIRKMIVR
jgi:hypothetical protein